MKLDLLSVIANFVVTESEAFITFLTSTTKYFQNIYKVGGLIISSLKDLYVSAKDSQIMKK